jgi:hypothetical protein
LDHDSFQAPDAFQIHRCMLCLAKFLCVPAVYGGYLPLSGREAEAAFFVAAHGGLFHERREILGYLCALLGHRSETPAPFLGHGRRSEASVHVESVPRLEHG